MYSSALQLTPAFVLTTHHRSMYQYRKPNIVEQNTTKKRPKKKQSVERSIPFSLQASVVLSSQPAESSSQLTLGAGTSSERLCSNCSSNNHNLSSCPKLLCYGNLQMSRNAEVDLPSNHRITCEGVTKLEVSEPLLNFHRKVRYIVVLHNDPTQKKATVLTLWQDCQEKSICFTTHQALFEWLKTGTHRILYARSDLNVNALDAIIV